MADGDADAVDADIGAKVADGDDAVGLVVEVLDFFLPSAAPSALRFVMMRTPPAPPNRLVLQPVLVLVPGKVAEGVDFAVAMLAQTSSASSFR